MYDRIAVWLVHQRKWLALLSVLVLVGLTYGATQLKFNGSYKIFFNDDNPQLLAHEKNEETYTKTNNILFVLELADETVFTRETLNVIENLTRDAWLLPYSSRVDSISNFQHTEVVEDDLMVADLIEEALSFSDEQLEKVKNIATNEIALVNRLVSDRAHTAAVNVVLNFPEESMALGAATRELVNAARELAAQVEAENSNIKIHLQGLSVVNNAFVEYAEYDSNHLFPILFLLIIVMLLVLLRSGWSSFATTLVIIASVMVSQGFMGWIGYDLNQVNVMAPIIILTLAVCDCVHILATYLHYLALGNSKKDAMVESMKINFQPVFLTSFTTAIGFLAMNASDVPPFQELGNISAFGVMAAFFFSVCLLPALAVWLPMKAKRIEEGQQAWTTKLANFIIKRRNVLSGGTLLVSIVIVSMAWLNELNDNTIDYFDKSTEFRQAADFMQDNLTGFDVLSYSIDSGESGGVNNPEFLKKVDEFATWYLSQPEVMNVQTYTDTIKRLNQDMHGDDVSWYRVPENRELAAQYQLLYELSLPYGLDLNNQVDADKRSLLVTAIVKGLKAKQILEMDERAQTWFSENAPELASIGSGVSVMFAHVGKKNIESMLSGSVMAIILITLTLIFTLGSIRYGLLSILPNAFPAMIAFGVWGMAVGEVDLGIAVIFSLTLGIVVDDTVHFFSKYIRARETLGRSAEDAVRYAFNTVAKPLLITTLVLVAGFSILMLSNFTVNAKMGVMISATISIALIFDFLLLPALLMKADEKKDEVAEEALGAKA